MKIKPIINTASAGRPLRVIASKRTKNVYSARRIGDSSQIARQRVAQTDVLYDAMNQASQGKTISQQSEMMETAISTINGASNIAQLQNPGFSAYQRTLRILSGALKLALKRGGETIMKTASAIMKEAVKQLSIWLGKIIQLLVNLVVNVVAEVIKYLLFGFIGGPWATIIPTVLNIIGPFLAVLSPLVPKVWNLGIKVVTKGVETAGELLRKFNDSQLKELVKQGAAWLLRWLRSLGRPIEDSLNAYLLRLINKV
jgi:hypothetical protein